MSPNPTQPNLPFPPFRPGRRRPRGNPPHPPFRHAGGKKARLRVWSNSPKGTPEDYRGSRQSIVIGSDGVPGGGVRRNSPLPDA